ncbi:MAG: MFS transporter, partial [Gemmatimonadota bacterium]
ALFPWIETRADDPVIRPALFRSRYIVIASGLAIGAGVTEAAVVFVPALLVGAFAVTASTASFMLLPIVAAMALGSPIAGRILDRRGSRVVVVAATALIAAGFAVVAVFPARLDLFYTAGLMIGLGMAGLLGSSLRYVMLNEAPTDDRGAAQGVLTVFISVGQLAGSAVIGAIIASRGGDVASYAAAFGIVAVGLTLLAVAALGLRSRDDERRRMGRDGSLDPAGDAPTSTPPPRA